MSPMTTCIAFRTFVFGMVCLIASDTYGTITGQNQLGEDTPALTFIDLDADFFTENIDWAVWESDQKVPEAGGVLSLTASDYKAGGTGVGKVVTEVGGVSTLFTAFTARAVSWANGTNETFGDNLDYTNFNEMTMMNESATGSGNGFRGTNSNAGAGYRFTFDTAATSRIARLFFRIDGSNVYNFNVTDNMGASYSHSILSQGNTKYTYEVEFDNSNGATQLTIDVLAAFDNSGIRFAGAALGSQSITGITDQVILEVNRDNGEINFINPFGAAANIRSYSITSASSGSLDSSMWESLTDAATPNWTETSMSANVLSEGRPFGGTSFSPLFSKNLGRIWRQNPTEDINFSFTLGDGTEIFDGIVNYTGTSISSGDLDRNGMINAADWSIFIANLDKSIIATTPAQSYPLGDLDGDLDNDFDDFILFRTAYDTVHGTGSLVALSTIPEPASVILLGIGWLCISGLLTSRRKPRLSVGTPLESHKYITTEKCDNFAASVRFPHSHGYWRYFMKIWAVLGAVCVAMVASETSADIVSIVDPVGGQEIDVEIGTLTLAAFNALNPVVQDWEGTGAMVGNNSPFSLGGVTVTGTYSDTEVNASFSGNRTSFTDPDGDGPLNGNWNSAADGGGFDFTEFIFAGPNVNAVGLAWLGRDNRPADPTITAVVTFGNSTTAMASIAVDGTGDGLPAGKDIFIGFNDPTGTGITKLTVTSDVLQFNGWDDIGVAFGSLDTPTLQVNTLSGAVAIKNSSSTSFNLDFYTISSSGGALDPIGWNSLSDQGISAVDGPDADNTVGNGPGETWDESGGSGSKVLSEAFLLGTTNLSTAGSLGLGSPFNTNVFGSGMDGDLVFKFHDNQYGPSLFEGNVEYVTAIENADFDGNGDVDGRDFLIWQRGFGSPGSLATGDADGNGSVNGTDLAIWQNQYGSSPNLSATNTVPEPVTSLLCVSLLTFSLSSRFRRNC